MSFCKRLESKKGHAFTIKAYLKVHDTAPKEWGVCMGEQNISREKEISVLRVKRADFYASRIGHIFLHHLEEVIILLKLV